MPRHTRNSSKKATGAAGPRVPYTKDAQSELNAKNYRKRLKQRDEFAAVCVNLGKRQKVPMKAQELGSPVHKVRFKTSAITQWTLKKTFAISQSIYQCETL